MNRESKTQFIARKRADAPAVNYIALMAGMISSIVLGLMVWNHFTTENNLEEIAESKSSSELSESEKELINSEAFASKLGSAKSEELEELLVRLNAWDRKAPEPVKIFENQKRVKVATAMLQLPLEEDQRNLAITSKIEALSAIYGIDFLSNLKTPDVGATLRATAEPHVTDPNLQVARTAQLAIVKVDAFDFIKRQGETKFEPTLERIIALLKNFPGDEFVISNIKLIVSSIVKYDQAMGVKVSRMLLARASEFEEPSAIQFFRSVSDQVTLANSKLDQLYSNRWVNGESGQRELFKNSLAMAGDSTNGAQLISRVAFIANWFEQEEQYERAMQIYQALEESADLREDIESALAAKRFASEGQKRCTLVGKKLEFNDLLISGDPITSADVEKRVVVLIFWSMKDRDSLQGLVQFHKDSPALIAKQVRVLAVCVDQSFDKTIAAIEKQIPRFQIVINSKTAGQANTMLSQCPPSSLPHAVIVDHLGVVKDCNVPLDELKTDSEYHVTRRFNSE